MERRHVHVLFPRADREVQVVSMKVDQVKLVFFVFLQHLFELHDMVSHLVYALGGKAQRLGTAGNQAGGRHRVPTGEQSHLMS
jgi:hypothetical protein